ncbi:hypothetical protein FOA52_003043 [Chlamydomonas sp. UWO 241]|nr:hypothetical protein FOA52_003043 [Chlamydomonas sp. UWO 241]
MRVRSPSPLNGGGGGDDEDDDEVELSDEDEEFDMVAAGAGFSSRAASNEDPKQWLLSILQADSGSVSKEHPNSEERVEVLRKALEHFNTAAELLEVAAKDAPAWPSGVSVSKDGVHAMEPNAPGKVDSGILLMLVFSQRVPGFPAVHDMEMQEGEVEYNRGQVHLALGNLNQAEEDFSTAIAINPTHAHYPHFRAVVFARKGEYNKAISWNLQALALNDGYFPATYHLGMVLHLVGRNAEALERINIALKRNPQAWAVLEACGRILQELDRHTPAVQALQDALRNLDPEEPMAVTARLHYAIAQSAISSHDVPLLRESLSQARMHGQDAASIYNLRGLLTRREKQLPKAAAYLSRAVALAPDEARFLFDRSQVHMERRRMDAAIADLTSALRLLPNNASLLYYRGTAYYLRALGSDDDISALADFEAAAHVFTDGHMWRS